MVHHPFCFLGLRFVLLSGIGLFLQDGHGFDFQHQILIDQAFHLDHGTGWKNTLEVLWSQGSYLGNWENYYVTGGFSFC